MLYYFVFMYVHLSLQCRISVMSHTQVFITANARDFRNTFGYALISMLRYLQHERYPLHNCTGIVTVDLHVTR